MLYFFHYVLLIEGFLKRRLCFAARHISPLIWIHHWLDEVEVASTIELSQYLKFLRIIDFDTIFCFSEWCLLKWNLIRDAAHWLWYWFRCLCCRLRIILIGARTGFWWDFMQLCRLKVALRYDTGITDSRATWRHSFMRRRNQKICKKRLIILNHSWCHRLLFQLNINRIRLIGLDKNFHWVIKLNMILLIRILSSQSIQDMRRDKSIGGINNKLTSNHLICDDPLLVFIIIEYRDWSSDSKQVLVRGSVLSLFLLTDLLLEQLVLLILHLLNIFTILLVVICRNGHDGSSESSTDHYLIGPLFLALMNM